MAEEWGRAQPEASGWWRSLDGQWHPPAELEGRSFPQSVPPPGPAGQPDRGNDLAATALFFGIVALLTGWLVIGGVAAAVGLVLGTVALRRAERRPDRRGRGAATTAIVLSSIGLAMAVISMAVWILSLGGSTAPAAADAADGRCNHEYFWTDPDC